MSEPQPGAGDPHQGRPGPSPTSGEQRVGGLGEEAVKLLSALQGLAGDHEDEVAGAAASALRAGAAGAQRVGEHLGNGSEPCRYCPVCQAVALARATPPEVRQHLAAAGTSLLRAVASLMATPVPDQSDDRGRPDVDDDPDDPADDAGPDGRAAAERDAPGDEWEDD